MNGASVGGSLWYAFGPQGETRQLTSSSGAVVDTYSYTAYGVPLSVTGSDTNPFRYGGQAGYYTDPAASGLALCGARWYDPYGGRWLSRDTIGYEGGVNLYEYCDGNPVGALDPSGTRRLTTQDCLVFQRLLAYRKRDRIPAQTMYRVLREPLAEVQAARGSAEGDPERLKVLRWAIGHLGSCHAGGRLWTSYLCRGGGCQARVLCVR